MNEKMLKYFEGIPENLEPIKKMNHPNEKVIIYSGDFKLKTDNIIIETKGDIIYEWIPDSRIKIYPSIKYTKELNELVLIKHFESGKDFDLILFDNIFGKIRIINISIGQSEPLVVFCLNGPGILKDNLLSTNQIRFDLPNTFEIFGLNTKRTSNRGVQGLISRITLEHDDFIIILDNIAEYKETIKKLRENGGIMIQSTGSLISKKTPISYGIALDILNCFSCFISFLNGKRTNTVFICGVENERILWEHHDAAFIQPYKYAHSLFIRYSKNTNNVNELWINFYKLWKENKSAFQLLMNWYTESNIRQGLLESALVTSQIALELLFNLICVESKAIISKAEAKKSIAARKIDILAETISFNEDSLYEFTHLINLFEDNKLKYRFSKFSDAIVFIRNAIVHSNYSKRTKLNTLSAEIMDDALEVSLQLIELLFLFFCGYKGEYLTRRGNAELVPWVK